MNLADRANRNVVWITGAGFSKFLGAPLLRELMTTRSVEKLKVAYSGTPHRAKVDRFEEVAILFETGVAHEVWADAEQFLEVLDTAVTHRDKTQWHLTAAQLGECSRKARKLGSRVPPIPPDGVLTDALRMLACEVSLFLKDADPSLERWQPYREWANRMAAGDSVITFNYDRIPELVSKATKDRLHIPTAGVDSIEDGMKPLVLKMHGSTDWMKKADGLVYVQDEDGCFDDQLELLIASPGPTKHRRISSGLFKPIWEKAQESVEHASCVVIIGYSMPPTDAGTKQWLLDRLRRAAANTTRSIRVHVVLGDSDQGAKDGARLSALIKSVSGRFVITTWPLRAEDFLGLHQRDELFAAGANEIPENIRKFTIV